MTTSTSPVTAPASTHHDLATTARATALIVGGILYALGNALHPMEHSHAAHGAPTWEAAHIVFAIGAVFIAVGLPGLAAAMATSPGSRLLAFTRGLLFLGFAVTVPISSYHEAFVINHVDDATGDAIESAAAGLTAPLGLLFLLGQLLLGVYALRRPAPALGRVAGGLIVLSTLVMVAGGSGAPGLEGAYVIPATVILGAVIATAGFKIARSGATPDIV